MRKLFQQRIRLRGTVQTALCKKMQHSSRLHMLWCESQVHLKENTFVLSTRHRPLRQNTAELRVMVNLLPASSTLLELPTPQGTASVYEKRIANAINTNTFGTRLRHSQPSAVKNRNETFSIPCATWNFSQKSECGNTILLSSSRKKSVLN